MRFTPIRPSPYLHPGDGFAVRFADDNGSSWQLGATQFGRGSHYSNECQAVELRNGSVLIISRSISDPVWQPHHLGTLSDDGGPLPTSHDTTEH